MLGILGFKVALCFAYLRITGNNIKSTYRRVIWLFMVFTILTHVGGTLVLLFQCRPMRKSWRPSENGICLPNDITFYILAAITIFCDVVIFFMPIPLLLRVQINTRRKIGLITIFMLGLFTTVCSVMRMVQIITISRVKDSTMLVLWGTIEMNVGVSFSSPYIQCSRFTNLDLDTVDLSSFSDSVIHIFRQQSQDQQIRSLIR